MNSYADPAWAERTGWSELTTRLHEIAGSAAPGSDLQLVAVNALAGCRLEPEQLTAIAGWLDGTDALGGLQVDADMTWTLLGALVAHGWRGEDDIAAAAANDATASGDRRAATARALLPLPEAKQAAFDRILHDDSMTNAFQEAALAGFYHPAQRALVEPFTSLYFEQIAAVWDQRSPEIARKLATGLFPRWSISAATINLANEFELDEHPPALRRLIVEGRAGLERALAARRCDAQPA